VTQATIEQAAADPDPLTEEERQELETIVDAIESVPQVTDVTGADGVDGDALEEHGVSDPGGKLPGLDLPGFAKESMQDYCGDKETHFCDECGETFDQSRRCSQSRCPDCWQSWVVDQAEHLTARLDTVARTRAARDGDGTAWHKHHVAIMLPPDWNPAGTPQERMENTKEAVATIIEDAWDAEGVALYHGWSGSGYGDEEEVAPGVDDRGEWPDRLADGREWEGDVRDELYRRPHFHAVITAPKIKGGAITREVYERTGWLINRIYDEDTNRSISGRGNDNASDDGEMQALASVITYCLSHNSIDTTGDTNQAQQVRVGSAWKDYRNVKVRDNVERSAVRAVRSVAPTTLGLPESRLKCDQLIAPERAVDADEHHTHDHDDGSDDEHDGAGETVTGRVLDVNQAAGTVTLAKGSETVEVDVEETDRLMIGDEVTVDGDGAVELEDPRVECEGASRHISEASEYVSSSTWRDRAQFARETLEEWERWQGNGPPP